MSNKPEPPDGFHIIPREWLEVNRLPSDAMIYYEGCGEWKESMHRGEKVMGLMHYATRTPLQPDSDRVGEVGKAIADPRIGTAGCPACLGTGQILTAGGFIPCYCALSKPEAEPINAKPVVESPVKETPASEPRDVGTPRTDEEDKELARDTLSYESSYEQMTAFARQLERETIELRQQLATTQSRLTEVVDEVKIRGKLLAAEQAKVKATPEVVELVEEWRKRALESERERDTLRKAVEDAPHEPDCNVYATGPSDYAPAKCFCWKSRVEGLRS